VGTDAEDYGDTYYRSHLGTDEPYEWANPHWRTFFTMVAERIRAVTNPSSVLDVGCARGLLVQAFCEQGIDAYGFDVSQHAIETAHPDVASRLSVGSAEEIAGTWDLITCIEVLEHMEPTAAERAIDSMSGASARVLLSSTPFDFSEPTHINVREPAEWAASFAERGFFRRTDVDLSFLAPWAVLFERAEVTRRDLVYRYERYAYPMRVEVLEKRAALRDAHRTIQESSDLRDVQSRLNELTAVNLDLRHNLLTSRDHAIGAEAEAAQWRRRYERELNDIQQQLGDARDELVETHRHLADTLDHLHTAYNSRTWRVGKAIVGPLSRLRKKHR
jgi:SAM-dependent methyltransferase